MADINYPIANNDELTQLKLDFASQQQEIEEIKGKNRITQYYPEPSSSQYTENISSYASACSMYEGVLWGHTGGHQLFKSDNYGESWENIGTVTDEGLIQHIEILSNGYALLFLYNGKLFKSTDILVDNSVGWEHVMTSAESIAFQAWYGLSVKDNVVFFNGYKEGSTATEAYLSLDYGDTWKTVFDMPHLGTATNNHVHDSEYDPYTGWLWVATGDNIESRNIYYSKDLGETWESIWEPGTAPLQFTSITARPESVLFGTDWATDWGIWRYDKATGKTESAYKFGEHTYDSVIASRPFTYNMDGKVVTFQPYSIVRSDVRWYLIATADGINYYMYSYGREVGEGSLNTILGVHDSRIVVGGHSRHVYTFDEPLWHKL